MLNQIIRFFLDHPLVTLLIALLLGVWGISTAPFSWERGPIPQDSVPVDAIPDIGENQQIVFTRWMGRSPQDIEDQITYPLTSALLGIPGVESVRSSSIFGFSSIYIIFEESIDFYWSRSRILEKLNSLPPNLLPPDVKPSLGPDATALGQVYWYTLEGRDSLGQPTGGWDLHELRSIQDYFVKYALNAVQGVSEVASIGGHVQEYQVDVDPNALKAYNIPLMKVIEAVRKSNRDVGAKTIEINQAEYLVRGLGYLKGIEDLELAVVDVQENVPIRIKDIGVVSLGPAVRRGMLDKDGAEVVGGVVVARYGSNPLEVINQVKDKIIEISPGLPKKILADGRESQLTIVPFYDRSQLIHETLGTLEEALSLEVLITIIVVVIMVLNLKASFLISSLLPLSILIVFIAMRYFGVDANIVALSGIAIAIGTMVDLGIVLSENVIKHIEESGPDAKVLETVFKAASEVSSAILAAVSTTIVSFIPVFAMEAAEGKLFHPLAFTKTFALIAALLVSLIILPSLANLVFGIKIRKIGFRVAFNGAMLIAGGALMISLSTWAGLTLIALSASWFVVHYFRLQNTIAAHIPLVVTAISAIWLLSHYWMPLGPERSTFANFLFVAISIGLILGGFILLEKNYARMLRWCLEHKAAFLAIPTVLILTGAVSWLGFGKMFGFVAKAGDAVNVNIRTNALWSGLTHEFPGMGKEFMPALDEGSFLLMPTSMPHSGFDQNKRMIQQLDMLVANIPEVELAVGKLGRVASALDPAPISMYENIINYKSEYALDAKGRRARFAVDDNGKFFLKNGGAMSNEECLVAGIGMRDLEPAPDGQYFRNWRSHIHSPKDIWTEISNVMVIPGMTSAPKLQPIETRLVMLQTGMRAPMGIKVFGPDLKSIESFGRDLEAILKGVPSVKQEAVFADRIVGKPYLHLEVDRNAIGRYGLNVEDVQHFIESSIGGMTVTSTVEGRERYPVRVRYPRELRDDPNTLVRTLVSTPVGVQVPLGELVDVRYQRGPQMIRSENTFLLGYVLFDKQDGYAEVEVVESAEEAIRDKIESGLLEVPEGVSYQFSGSYENQVRAEKRLGLIVPIVLIVILLILYLQFRSLGTALMIFTGIAMAFSGAFLLLHLYGQPWFLDFSILGMDLRNMFQIREINLSVAVWVGFIALFGIATDDGVLMGTYLDQSFAQNSPSSRFAIREAVVEAGRRRIRPAVMTSATTLIALLPVLTSTGRGSDIMVPMAIPAFGGMLVASITYFIVPVLYSMRAERLVKNKEHAQK